LECRNLKDPINSSTRNVMETTRQEEADKAVHRKNREYFHALGFMVIQYARSNETWYVKFYLNTLILLQILPIIKLTLIPF
jgi:hypothetical protein